MEHNERIDSGAGEPVLACKRRKHLRLVALAVCCALLGGIAGGAATGLLLQGRERAAMRPAGQQTAVSGGESTGAEPSAARVASTAGELTPTQLYERYAPCVVGVLNLSAVTDLYGKDTMQASTGSGVLLTGDGEILTNYHVVKDCTQLTVTLYDGTEHTAKLLGYEENSDIALLKIDGSGYRHARLGDSDRLRIGTEVAAIGNPLGYDDTATTGIVSALNRPVTVTDDNNNEIVTNAVQIDAAINPGNSGGPTFNAAGQVIGINSSIASTASSSGTAGSIGIGFAIPSNLVKRVANEIIDNGSVRHVVLGITIKSSSVEADGVTRGCAQVQAVTDGGPASKAGVKAGDSIVAFNGKAVNNNYSLLGYVRASAMGDKVKLTVVRGGNTMDLEVTLDQEETKTNSSNKQEQRQQNNGNDDNGNGQNGGSQNGQNGGNGNNGDGGGLFDPFGLW